MKHILLITMMLATMALPGGAYGQGSTGAEFLKLEVGPKAQALGGASFVGVADDASAVYWNPAGLTTMTSGQLYGMQNWYLLDMSHQVGALVIPTRYGAYALAFSYFSAGDIPQYENFQSTGRTFSASDMSGTLAYAHRLGDVFSLGLGLKMIYQQLEVEQAWGYAVDLGLLSHVETSAGRIGVGVAVQNIGPGLTFIERRDPLPFSFKTGVSYRVGGLLMAGGMVKARDDRTLQAVGGVELSLQNVLAFRIGYRSPHEYATGAGLRMGGLRVDYAFVPYESLGNIRTHRIAMGISF
jgi:long-subunit fatty acid transport protein